MQISPIAKINLGLNVVARRPDGYHDLETVFYPVAVSDKLEITSIDRSLTSHINLTVEGGGSDLADTKNNLVCRAYDALDAHLGHTLPAVSVHLTKGIPSQAGMGGGSSDAAFMLRLLRDSLSLSVSTSELEAIAGRLGADCAFFVRASASEPEAIYATGIGDQLHARPDLEGILRGRWIALVKPPVAVSTKEAYAGVSPHTPGVNCAEALAMPIERWRDVLVNDFEHSVFSHLPVLAEVKQAMYERGALYAAMSGSGSTIYGIFDSEPSVGEWSVPEGSFVSALPL